jgi:hypothetical protein
MDPRETLKPYPHHSNYASFVSVYVGDWAQGFIYTKHMLSHQVKRPSQQPYNFLILKELSTSSWYLLDSCILLLPSSHPK